MTEKDAKEYLNSINHFRTDVLTKINQITELRVAAESCTVRTDKENIQSSGSGDKLANIVGRIVDLENEILDVYGIYAKRRQIVMEITDKMTDKRQSQFLTYRYLKNYGFYDTLFEMGLSDTTGKRVCQKSIAEFTRRYNEKHSNH